MSTMFSKKKNQTINIPQLIRRAKMEQTSILNTAALLQIKIIRTSMIDGYRNVPLANLESGYELEEMANGNKIKS